MIIDFQHHYTPPQLLQGKKKEVSVGVDKNGNPMHLLNPLLGDIDAHVRMMDAAGIDAAVLSSMVGFDQPDLKICRIINDDLKGVEEKHPGRFIGLAHVPALKTAEMKKELKRCKVELGFPGVVIASEMQGLGLDAPELKPFWKTCADLELYVFIHPLAKVIDWNQMYADDLGRMLGWQFSLMTAAVRVMNSGLLDKLPDAEHPVRAFRGRLGALSRARARLPAARQMGHVQAQGPQPPAGEIVRLLSRAAAVLRLRRLGGTGSRGALGRGVGAFRHARAGAAADRVRDRLSASRARRSGSGGLRERGAGAWGRTSARCWKG